MIEKYTSRRNLKLVFNLILNSFKILLRYFKLYFHGEKLICNSFNVDSNYSIAGTINQLRWDVENAIFITICESSKIYFNSDQLLFLVNKEKTKFQLKAYGTNRRTTLFTCIKVKSLAKKNILKINLKSKNPFIKRKEDQLLKNITPFGISLKYPKEPISCKRQSIHLNSTDYISDIFQNIAQTTSKKELENIGLILNPNTNQAN
ncbi:hypothetical protein [Maribacter aurantiacus]|uniref:Uncharacterized protein n=1 Tax=Maribacter aurantiacus TaxID=1882343 RepID=A0A5R8M5H4_9FLAO|nr:hypothetical protein [Maribacter aurantiacus]TLF44828.1 hypothetical protein FEK29_08670 [Maribacter aurantiacus]